MTAPNTTEPNRELAKFFEAQRPLRSPDEEPAPINYLLRLPKQRGCRCRQAPWAMAAHRRLYWASRRCYPDERARLATVCRNRVRRRPGDARRRACNTGEGRRRPLPAARGRQQ